MSESRNENCAINTMCDCVGEFILKAAYSTCSSANLTNQHKYFTMFQSFFSGEDFFKKQRFEMERIIAQYTCVSI